MPFQLDNEKQTDRWKAEYACIHTTVNTDRTIALSGRAYVVVSPHHLGSSVMTNGSHATIALCHLSWRSTAQRGDVLFMVSPSGPISRQTMTVDEGRLLLAVFIDDGNSLAPSTFYGINAPDWVKGGGQRDRVYSCRVVGAGPRDQRASLDALDDGRNHVARTIRSAAGGGWMVTLRSGAVLHYTSRPRARYHNANMVMTLNKRKRDFQNRVSVSRNFAVFPGDSGARRVVRLNIIKRV